MIDLNICLLPDEKTSKYCIDLSKKISQENPSLILLDSASAIPHMSIYHVSVPMKNKQKTIKSVEKLIKEIFSFQVDSRSISSYHEYVFLYVKKSIQVQNIHQKVIENLNPLREGKLGEWMTSYISKTEISERKKEYIRVYGHPLIKKDYMPHITISKLNSQNVSKNASSSSDIPRFKLGFDKIAVGNIGPHGTLSEIMATYKLK